MDAFALTRQASACIVPEGKIGSYGHRTTPALFLGCVPVLTKELFSFNFFHEVRICIYTYICLCLCMCHIYMVICVYFFFSIGLFLGCMPVLTKELFSFNFFYEVRGYIFVYYQYV